MFGCQFDCLSAAAAALRRHRHVAFIVVVVVVDVVTVSPAAAKSFAAEMRIAGASVAALAAGAVGAETAMQIVE